MAPANERIMALLPYLVLGAFALLITFFLTVGKVPIGYNIRNLLVRWRITVLTASAFTLVVGLLTVMLGFVNGMYKMTESSGQPGNVMILADGATDELFSNMAYSDTSNIERQPGVLIDPERKVPLCSREVYIVVTQPIPAPEGEPQRRRFVQVRGLDDALSTARVQGIELYPGASKWFSDAGVQEIPGKDGKPAGTAVQAVLGEGIAGILGKEQNKASLEVGDRFELGGRQWVVCGLMQAAGSLFGSEIWAKRSVVGPLFGKDQITCMVVRTADAKAAEALASDLSHNFKPAVRAEPQTVYYSKLSDTNKQFMGAIIFVALIMAVGGVFGVMNTMFAAISQRTKDIGVLRILGFARWQILVSFFLETLFLALVGGLLGCAIGYCFNGWQATSVLSSGAGGGGKTVVLKLIVDARTIAVGLLFTLIMGALGGFLPALSAMRLRALESLK
jgi:ABC-type antimicrobial peptide transport system permease subunit